MTYRELREERSAAAASQECWVTQIIRWSGPRAVVRVKTAADVIVALPSALPPHEALGLAKLVLDGSEYAELAREITRKRPRKRAATPQIRRACGNHISLDR